MSSTKRERRLGTPRLSIRRELRTELIASVMVIVAVVAFPVVSNDLFWQQTMLLACVYLIAASGLDILRSQAGQMSFGQGAVVGVAAYTTALATTVWAWPAPWPVVGGLSAGMAFGMLLALPSLRVQGYYLGFVTMAGALALPQVFFMFSDQTHALTGVNIFPSAVHETITGNLDWLTVIVALATVIAVAATALLRSSKAGRQMRVAAESAEAAQTLGLRPGRLRLQGFAIASFAASVAGVLYVGVIQYVAPGSFTLAVSIMLYFIVIVGGPGTVAGPIAGVAVLYLLPDHVLSGFADYRLLIYGLIAFAVMFLLPDGIVGGLRRLPRRLRVREVPDTGSVSLRPVLEHAPSPSAQKDRRVTELFVAEDVRRSFGSVVALDGASITVSRGHLHAIVGPNGSGKTTLLNAMSGLIGVDGGRMTFDGTDVTGWSASRRARAGLARTFQTPRILTGLSVWENVDCGGRAHQPIPWIDAALEEVRASWDHMSTSGVPHGQRRFLEVLRALRQGPTMLALDEPAAGLSRSEREEFGRLMRQVIETTGVTLVMVEHDLELVWGVADVITAVDSGRVIASGPPADLRDDPRIAHLFVGVEHAES